MLTCVIFNEKSLFVRLFIRRLFLLFIRRLPIFDRLLFVRRLLFGLLLFGRLLLIR